MHATIWAPPGNFVVDTPSAVAVDMGCRYTLEVDERGAGLLRVEAGWVGFEHRGLQSLVPAGAMCATRTGIGPGTPSFETASPAFSEALETIDFGPAGDARRAALDRVLAEARARDALSLWHLLTRVEGEDRARVFDRLQALVPAPAGVTRDGILRGSARCASAGGTRSGSARPSSGGCGRAPGAIRRRAPPTSSAEMAAGRAPRAAESGPGLAAGA